jgi:hypothetical protein
MRNVIPIGSIQEGKGVELELSQHINRLLQLVLLHIFIFGLQSPRAENSSLDPISSRHIILETLE